MAVSCVARVRPRCRSSSFARSADASRRTRSRRLTRRHRALSAPSGIRGFFRCAVVIDVQCRSIRDCAASPVSSWLGGQNGEEVKIEDEVRREENGAQDREAEGLPQEEVRLTPHRAKRLRNEDCVAFSRRGRHAERNAPQLPRRLKSTKEASAKSRLAFRRSALNRPQGRCHTLLVASNVTSNRGEEAG